MKLDINKQLVDSSLQAIRKAYYITDVKVTGNGSNIELHAYAKIPLFGRIWSFLRHVCVKKNNQNRLVQQITDFKDFHEGKTKKYVENAINTANDENSDFDELIETTYEYHQHIDEISQKFLRQSLPSFHAIALNKFNDELSSEVLSDTEQELGEGNLQAVSERIAEIKTLSQKVDKYIATSKQHLPMTQAILNRQSRLQNILAKHDALEKIEDIMTRNQLAIDANQKIPALNAIIDERPVASDEGTKAFEKAMQDLLPHLRTHFPTEGINAQDFCIRFKRHNKQIACEQAIVAMHNELKANRYPELLVATPLFRNQYQNISQKAGKHKDSESIDRKFTDLKADYDYWDHYIQLTTSKEITLEELNEDGFFDKLIQTHPAKTIILIAKLASQEADAAIQKVLPHKENMNDDNAKQQLIDLAQRYCTLPEFVKYRVEKTIVDRNLVAAHFETYIVKILESFNSWPDPSKVALKEEVKSVYGAISGMEESDIQKYSDKFKSLCDELKTKMEFWRTYFYILEQLNQGIIPQNFNEFFKELIKQSPKNALTILAYAPEQNPRQQNVKKNAFVSYLTWHSQERGNDSSFLMPEDANERKLFLTAAYRLSIFDVYDVFKNVAMPEFVKIHAKETGKLFNQMLDELIHKLDSIKGIDTKKLVNELDGLKTTVTNFKPKKGSIQIVDFLTYFQKDLVSALSKLPYKTFLDFDYYPDEETLVWCKPYRSESENNDYFENYPLTRHSYSSPLKKLYSEAALTSLISAVLKGESNNTVVEDLTEHFEAIISYNIQAAYQITVKLNYEKGLVETLFKSYGNEKPFHDLNIAAKEKDALRKIVCENIFTFDLNQCLQYAWEINDSKVRDPLLVKIALKLAEPKQGWHVTSRDAENLKSALGIVEKLGSAQKDQFYETIVLEKDVKMEFQERLDYALKISSPYFREKPRDKVLVEMLSERSCWEKFEDVQQILSNISDKKKYQAQFLDIIKALCANSGDIQFAKLIAKEITDKDMRQIADNAINSK